LRGTLIRISDRCCRKLVRIGVVDKRIRDEGPFASHGFGFAPAEDADATRLTEVLVQK